MTSMTSMTSLTSMTSMTSMTSLTSLTSETSMTSVTSVTSFTFCGVGRLQKKYRCHTCLSPRFPSLPLFLNFRKTAVFIAA